jgi:aminoglycoside phosphotransferase (APT) family kinase protein
MMGALDLVPKGASNLKICKMSRITGGKHGTYDFSLSFSHKGKNLISRLILKLYTEEKTAKIEYQTLRALERGGFSVPHAYVFESKEKFLGAPFIILEKVEGETLHNYLKHLNTDEALNYFERFA